MSDAHEPNFEGAGAALWHALTDAYTLDRREQMLAMLAVGQANQLADLEAKIAESELLVQGSQGQPKLSPLVAEARLARLSLAKLLSMLDLPSSASAPGSETFASKRGRAAANARWSRERARREALEVVRQRDAG